MRITHHIVKRFSIRTIALLACSIIFTQMFTGDLQAAQKPSAPLQGTFFYSPSCRLCGKAKRAMLEAEETYGEKINIEWVNTSDPDTRTASMKRFFTLLNQHHEKSTPPVALFIGGICLAGSQSVIDNLDSTLKAALAAPPERVNQNTIAPLTIDRTSFIAISLAALADGINPCAFATVILLISLMALAEKSTRETIVIGFSFTAGIFITYFLIGFTGYHILQEIFGLSILSDIIYSAAFLMCVVAAVLSLHDAYRLYRGGKAKDMTLKLPERLRLKIRSILSSSLASRKLHIAIFMAGVMIALLESACTGIVYIPVIMGTAKLDMTRGMLLLLWYNFLFILPLVVVFVIRLQGIRSGRMVAFAQRHTITTKCILALTFAFMAYWLTPGILG